MKDLYIIGAGGFGREVAWLVERLNDENPTWRLKGFVDDNQHLWGTMEDGYPVLGGIEYLMRKEGAYAVCAVGSAVTRKRIVERFKGSAVRFATLIDPSVLMSKRVTVGEGSIICAGTIITVDVTIGRHVIINLDCTLGHDDVVGDFVTMYPSVNVSGNVVLGACTELGTGTQIIQGKRIATETIVGAGSVVGREIMEGGTYVGAPAKKIK